MIPTVGGGRQVVFNDVEVLTQVTHLTSPQYGSYINSRLCNSIQIDSNLLNSTQFKSILVHSR